RGGVWAAAEPASAIVSSAVPSAARRIDRVAAIVTDLGPVEFIGAGTWIRARSRRRPARAGATSPLLRRFAPRQRWTRRGRSGPGPGRGGFGATSSTPPARRPDRPPPGRPPAAAVAAGRRTR